MYVNYKRYTEITVEQVFEALATNDAWLERAIVALHDRQTELEKQTRTTYLENEIGLQQADAKLFSKYAEQIKRLMANGRQLGQCLSDVQKRVARRPWHRPRVPIPTICKYRVQVWSMINEKARIQKEQSA